MMTSSSPSASAYPKMYIYDLPYLDMKELCALLDHGHKYEELAAVHMQFPLYITNILRHEIYKGKSPTQKLLQLWGNENHTVLELFVLLSRMRHYRAMMVLKKFVDPRYHHLIRETEENLAEILEGMHHMLRHPVEGERDRRLQNGVEQDRLLCPKVEKKILNAAPEDDGNRKFDGDSDGFVFESEEDNEKVGSMARRRPPVPGTRKPHHNNNNNNIAPVKSALPGGAQNTGASAPPADAISNVLCVAAESSSAIPQIPYADLQESTQNWSPKAILGRGGFGTVFIGTWKCTKVAVKRIENKQPNNPDAHNELIIELRYLNAYRHDNVLPLYGYSVGGPQPCLVYQYMSGGSLDYRLHTRDPTKILQWPTRLNIAIGTARGLQFLHTIGKKPLVHGDIKSANILLDSNDMARIGDFGLAREGPKSEYTYIKLSKIHGTLPYLPDEFLRAKRFSPKVDTYSFGVVLFEIATGLGAYSDKRPNKFLKDHVVEFEGDHVLLKDARVPGYDGIFQSLLAIGKVCTGKLAKERPEMVSVLIQLEAVS